MLPRHSVASQLKILIPVGTATASDVIMKKPSTPIGSGVGEHVVRPDEHAEEARSPPVATAIAL